MFILIVDDHQLFVDGLKPLLKRLGPKTRLECVAGLGPARAFLGRGVHPDLILLDISLRGQSGLKAVPELRLAAPTSVLVLLSAVDDPLTVREGLRLGAQGFLSKSISGREMVAGLKRAMAGETVVRVPPAEGQEAPPSVSPRQRQVLALLAEGLTNKDIAQKLHMAPGTVRTHLMAIFRVLGVTTRTQAVVQAQRLGLYKYGE